MKKKKSAEKELDPFQLRNIQLLTHLFTFGAINDDVVELIRQSELDYYSLIIKYNLLEEKVNIDEKTNLLKYNKNYLTNIIKTASRIYHGIDKTNYSVSFVRFDIDNFSVFNNKYGHDVGDKILIKLASILKKNSRPTDYVIRFGGEEFDVILPATPKDNAILYMEKIYNKLKDLKVTVKKETKIVTVSAGLSTIDYSFNDKKFIKEADVQKNYNSLQREADDSLYEAKYSGKNKFCIYSKNKENDYKKFRELYSKKLN